MRYFTRWDADRNTYYETRGTRHGDKTWTLRNEVYGAIGFVLLVGAMLIALGVLSR
jgi:hypothetical protein